jgi:periplasmic protein TonB
VSIEPEQKPRVPVTPESQQQPAKPMAQQQFTKIHITIKPIETTAVPTQADLTAASISNKTIVGTASPVVLVQAEPPTGNNSESLEKPATTPANVEPQFPGGAAAWAAFLSRHLQAPEPLEAGEKITVLVRFLVNEIGTVTGFEIIKSGGEAFDREVLRVLHRMPKWKPALRNGQPTAVSFTQPVTFIAAD